jgi:hypothetical protein
VEITFTKTDQRKYETLVRRDDGVLLSVQSPDRPASLPHDIAHYLVERELKLERGFWGSVAAGAVFGGMHVISGRRSPHAEDRSKAAMKAAGQQLTVAEIYVSVMQSVVRDGKEGDWPAVRARLDEAWRPFRGPRWPVSAEEALRVCQALREAETQWQALPVGQSITVTWQVQTNKGTQRMRRPAGISFSKARARR